MTLAEQTGRQMMLQEESDVLFMSDDEDLPTAFNDIFKQMGVDYTTIAVRNDEQQHMVVVKFDDGSVLIIVGLLRYMRQPVPLQMFKIIEMRAGEDEEEIRPDYYIANPTRNARSAKVRTELSPIPLLPDWLYNSKVIKVEDSYTSQMMYSMEYAGETFQLTVERKEQKENTHRYTGGSGKYDPHIEPAFLEITISVKSTNKNPSKILEQMMQTHMIDSSRYEKTLDFDTLWSMPSLQVYDMGMGGAGAHRQFVDFISPTTEPKPRINEWQILELDSRGGQLRKFAGKLNKNGWIKGERQGWKSFSLELTELSGLLEQFEQDLERVFNKPDASPLSKREAKTSLPSWTIENWGKMIIAKKTFKFDDSSEANDFGLMLLSDDSGIGVVKKGDNKIEAILGNNQAFDTNCVGLAKKIDDQYVVARRNPTSDWIGDDEFIDDIIIARYDDVLGESFFDEQLGVLAGSLEGALMDTLSNKEKNIADMNELLKSHNAPITVTDLKYEDDYFYWKYTESRRNPRGCYPCPECGTMMYETTHSLGSGSSASSGSHCSCWKCGANFITQELTRNPSKWYELVEWSNQHKDRMDTEEYLPLDKDDMYLHFKIPGDDEQLVLQLIHSYVDVGIPRFWVWLQRPHYRKKFEDIFTESQSEFLQTGIPSLGITERHWYLNSNEETLELLNYLVGNAYFRPYGSDAADLRTYLTPRRNPSLKKASCCCGATEENPCVCMYKGVMQCSSTEPMCPCYTEKQQSRHNPVDHHSFVIVRHVGRGFAGQVYKEVEKFLTLDEAQEAYDKNYSTKPLHYVGKRYSSDPEREQYRQYYIFPRRNPDDLQKAIHDIEKEFGKDTLEAKIEIAKLRASMAARRNPMKKAKGKDTQWEKMGMQPMCNVCYKMLNSSSIVWLDKVGTSDETATCNSCYQKMKPRKNGCGCNSKSNFRKNGCGCGNNSLRTNPSSTKGDLGHENPQKYSGHIVDFREHMVIIAHGKQRYYVDIDEIDAATRTPIDNMDIGDKVEFTGYDLTDSTGKNYGIKVKTFDWEEV